MSAPRAPAARETADFVQSLAKGLAVLETFGADAQALTLSEVARRTGISRAAARRLLHTLVALGFAEQRAQRFTLRPRVLNLGFAYLHSMGLPGIAQPYMVELVETLHESCSAGVLDGRDVVYVARVPTRKRIMSISLGIGTRLPAHATSMGRVLLAALTPEERERWLADAAPLARPTEYALADADALREELDRVAAAGYAIVEQELELGVRSVAVPLRGADGSVVAALNVGTHAARTSTAELREVVLPQLQQTAAAISRALGA